jgi:hypothetical protein
MFVKSAGFNRRFPPIEQFGVTFVIFFISGVPILKIDNDE